jgi:hypothetical protein
MAEGRPKAVAEGKGKVGPFEAMGELEKYVP